MKENGTIDSNTYLRGRKRVLNEEDLQNIDNLLGKQYDLTIGEVKDPPESLDLRKNCSESRPEAGIHYKKKSLHVSEQECPRCTETESGLEQSFIGTRHKTSGISG